VNENDESRGHRESQGSDQSLPPRQRKASGLAEAIKHLFQEVKMRLTRKAHAPQPTPRHRTEETRGGFKRAGEIFMRRSLRLPAAAYYVITCLSDTLDWLNPWHNETASASELNEDFQQEPQQHHLYPHL
jgi:hypothetical protein